MAARQQAINTAYDKLVQGAELRRKALEEAIRLFALFRECDEVEVWIREKVSGQLSMHTHTHTHAKYMSRQHHCF